MGVGAWQIRRGQGRSDSLGYALQMPACQAKDQRRSLKLAKLTQDGARRDGRTGGMPRSRLSRIFIFLQSNAGILKITTLPRNNFRRPNVHKGREVSLGV
jgi:hypothetical protein